jgi:hypothetical protein
MFQKPSNHHELSSPRGNMKQVHNEDPQILCCTVQNLVTLATSWQGLLHPQL